MTCWDQKLLLTSNISAIVHSNRLILTISFLISSLHLNRHTHTNTPTRLAHPLQMQFCNCATVQIGCRQFISRLHRAHCSYQCQITVNVDNQRKVMKGCPPARRQLNVSLTERDNDVSSGTHQLDVLSALCLRVGSGLDLSCLVHEADQY